MVIWNYRGYGRSQGIPSPKNLAKDAELLIDHLRDKLNIKTIGIVNNKILNFIILNYFFF